MDWRSKLYQCTICLKRFNTEIGRVDHQMKVDGDYSFYGVFPCSYESCTRKRTFRREVDVGNHLKNPGKWHQRRGVITETPKKSSFSSSSEEEKALFDRACSSQEVNIFIREQLQSDKEFHRLYNDAFDSLYKGLQRNLKNTVSYEIHNLIEGGSVAKGTALKKHSDLDCVIVMNEITNASQLSSKLPDILGGLESDKSGLSTWKWDHSWQLDSIETTNFSVQFNMTRSSESVKVDLLPTFRIEDSYERKKVYKEMRGNKKIRPYCSAALVRAQVEFVEKQLPNVKDLIRLVKYWRKTCIPQIGNEHLPPSYLLELLTIHAWEKAKCPKTFDMKIGFKAVMKLLTFHYKLRVYWGDYYGKDVITCSLKGPHVIDPANPTNNLYSDVNCWRKVRKTAEETMGKPLLRDVRVSDNWS